MYGASAGTGAATVSSILNGGVSAGILVGVVSGIFYLVVAGIRWAGELRLQSGEWFHSQINRRFRTAAASKQAIIDGDDGLGMESESVQVREFIEKLVEKLLNGGLDDVCVSKLHSHPEYKPLSQEDSPTAAHAALKKLIQEIIQEAMTLPAMQEGGGRKNSSSSTAQEDVAFKTYEDILATAILNKVIERYQVHKFTNGSALDGNSNLLRPSNSVSSMDKQTKYISSLEIGVKKVDDGNISSKEISETDSDDLKWSKSDLTDPSLSVTIEEHIEEVTTYSNSDGEEDEADNDEKLFVPDLKLLQRRVPFPEFGIDIIEGADMENNDEESDDFADASADHQPTDLVSPVESWEENWLFQRRRLKPGSGSSQMPVPMLVPNPSEDFRALIGDRDAEDVSDLSECSDSALEDLVLAEGDPSENTRSDDEKALANNGQSSLLLEIGESSDFDCMKEEKNKRNCNSSQNDELVITASDSTKHQGSLLDVDLDVSEATNMELLKTSMDCSSEFGQKDSEYTEDYDAVTQRQMDSLTNLSESEQTVPPVPKPRSVTTREDDGDHTTKEQEVLPKSPEAANTAPDEEESHITELAVPPRPGTELSGDEKCTLPCTGTIAEREHKKWESAPPLPNNPYSPENISKRLNRKKFSSSHSSSSEASIEFPELKGNNIAPVPVAESLHVVCAPGDLDYKRYGRDYYVNSKANEDEKKSSSPVKVLSHEKNLRQTTSKVSSDVDHLSHTSKDDKKETLVTKKNGNTELIQKNQEESLHEKQKKELPEQKNDLDYLSDPEIPAPGTVIHEIARWQTVINETEQMWIKNSDSFTSDTGSKAEEECEIIKNSKNKKSNKLQNGEIRPKVADIYLQGINNIKINGDVKNNSPQNSDLYLEDTNNKKPNGDVKSRISNITVEENNTINELKEDKLDSGIKRKPSRISDIYLEKINNSKNTEEVTKKTATPLENDVGSDTESKHINKNAYLTCNADKPVPKPRSDRNIEIIHIKTNSKETVSRIDVTNRHPEIKINVESEDMAKQVPLNSSTRLDTLSVASEGSVGSSDSELYNFLPSVKQLAKQFSGTQDSDSSSSSFKSPSPAPKWRKADERTQRTPAPLSPIPDAAPVMDSQPSPRNSLSPSHPVREIHSLTARSISREFREGLKRNLPAQMDRNLYTLGSDGNHSVSRSVERNGVSRQEEDSTPGYTSDESSTHSSSPTNEIQEIHKLPKPKTLQNSIAFWEQMRQK